MWDNASAASIGLLPGRRTIGPLLLMTICPLFTIFLWHAYTKDDGSLVKAAADLREHGFGGLLRPWRENMPTARIWRNLGYYALFELALMKIPAATYFGPITAKGNVPEYTANGVPAFLVTMATALVLHLTGTFALDSLYDDMGSYLVALNFGAVLFCAVLYFKGRFMPTTSDWSLTGNVVFDYYWGVELYPAFFGFDVKTFTNCRFGMMAWPIMVLAFCCKQATMPSGLTNSMVVSAVIQFAYLFKFYWWETGYFSSIDIMHDHAGYYICYGCLSWVPIVYTSPGLFLVNRPYDWPLPVALAITFAGVACVFINYDSDRQRQQFRLAHGKANVWGSKPRFITAEYSSGDGKTNKSLLLASGYWGLSRHFHYVPEILAACFWTLPGGFSSTLQWFYVIFLVCLLTDRAFRDDARCANKYGAYWQKYCELVPWRIVPFVI